MCWRCSPIRRGASTWAMCATTRWATSSRATSARRASTCCIRWAGTPSACRPRTPRCRTRSIRANWTYDNIAAMRAQLKSHGPVARLVARIRHLRPRLLPPPADAVPRLAGQGPRLPQEAKVNWDPVDKTVLANEQVIDGRGWRSGAAGRAARADAVVLQDHRLSPTTCSPRSTRLERWPDKVRLMQGNWIGKLAKACDSLRRRRPRRQASTTIEVYTTRPDTLFGASFVAIAPTIRWPSSSPRRTPTLAAFIEECRRMAAPRRPRSRRPRRWASTPASRSCIPFDPDLAAAGLGRQLRADGLRHRRHLRLPGA